MSNRSLDVLLSRDVFKVFKARITAVFVLVVYFFAFGNRTDEGNRHDDVNRFIFLTSWPAQADRRVSSYGPWFHNAIVLAQALDPAKIAYFVKRSVSNDRFPCLAHCYTILPMEAR